MKLMFSVILLFPLFIASSHGQIKRFTVLSTTDEHSTFLPVPLSDYDKLQAGSAVGGYARLSALVEEIRDVKQDEPVLLFSSGDIMGGTPFSWLALEGYSYEIELMRRINYDAMTIGNHEFDYGPDHLADYFTRAGYPGNSSNPSVISSNLIIPEGDPLRRIGLKEREIFELSNGIRLGVFGLLGKGAYNLVSKSGNITIQDPLVVAEREVYKLKEAGADIILALTHSGTGEDYSLAENVDGIDIILGGHDHSMSKVPESVNGTLVFHSGHYLRSLGILEFEWNSETRELTTVNSLNRNPYHISLDHYVDSDYDVLSFIDTIVCKLNDYIFTFTEGMFSDISDPVICSKFSLKKEAPLVETAVGNFVTDAIRLTGEKVTGEKVHFAFQGNGIIRADIEPGSLKGSEGEISLFDLINVCGLGTGSDGKAGYPLVSVYLTGSEIYNILETTALLSQIYGDIFFLQVSGLRYSYDPGKSTWLTIPFLNIPLPSYRSVQNAEIFTGEGVQKGDSFNHIEQSGDELYHVVTDYYLISFLPMVGEMLPKLRFVPKDINGKPVNPSEAIIYDGERELKVWEALLRYASSLDVGDSGLPEIPVYYRSTGDRITRQEGVPLVIWSCTIIVIFLTGLGYFVFLAVKRIRRR